jgi:hypothetical protein
MLCKNRITLIGFLGQDAESRSTTNGNTYTRFSLATSVSWKEPTSNEYKTRTEWHRVICWNKLAQLSQLRGSGAVRTFVFNRGNLKVCTTFLIEVRALESRRQCAEGAVVEV